ncbi:MAG: TIGR03986 family CRISPR-associated RAMP protein [Chloroflexi bacterium]|nr:MAG: TIGR03986 family CRISPR-associated RAMP protein [Chloroflexota bacterium]
MSLPQHQNPTAEKDAALAPYNFVPLPEQVVAVQSTVDHSRYHPQPERYTGLIHCTLTTASPFYTRAALERADFKESKESKDKIEAFYVDPVTKDPVIPGSSLRGMVRTLVEIASFGKLDAVGETPLVYRAVGDITGHGDNYRKRLMQEDMIGYNGSGKRVHQYTPLMQAGYMKKLQGDRWQIEPAQKIGGVTFARINLDALERIQSKLTPVPGCRNAALIYIQPGPYDYQDVRGGFLRVKQSRVLRAAERPGPGLIEATVARSGHMASKRSEAVIFPKDPQAKPIPVSDELHDDYHAQLSQEQEKLLGNRGVFNDGQPVFYLMENDELVFLSHTMMMRLPYEKTPKDFVPAALRSADQIDLAEAIFGFVRQDKQRNEQSRAGRVFFSDAHLFADQDRNRLWLTDADAITLKILGSPKPTTFQHYLTQQEPDPQIARYTRDGRPQYKKELADYTAAQIGKAVLRGHKLYWHKGEVQLGDVQEDQQKLASAKKADTQHTRVKPVAPGVNFAFTVRFENLAEVELGALLWALILPGEANKAYRHKLGMGKPLGMGSVQLQAQLVLSDRQQRYRQLFTADGAWDEALTTASVDPFVQAYEQFVLSHIHASERGQAQRLSEVLRIRMLLKLLEWPGPPKEQTRYLEIEREDPNVRRGKVNEYRGRPVLPDPLAVVEPGSRAAGRRSGQTSSRGQTQQPARDRTTKTASVRQTPTPVEIQPSRPATTISPKPATPAEPATKPPPELAEPRSLSDVKEGMWLEGKVVRVDQNSVMVDVGVGENASLYKDHIQPAVRDQEDLEERFPTGKVVRVWVRGFNRRGRIQLTMKDPRP